MANNLCHKMYRSWLRDQPNFLKYQLFLSSRNHCQDTRLPPNLATYILTV